MTRSVSRRTVTMRLSDMDWEIVYGAAPRNTGGSAGWSNPHPPGANCLSDVAWLVFRAKGGVGVLTARKNPEGFGYVTTYRVPDNLFEAHRVVGVRVGVSKRIPIAILVSRYGPADEVLGMPGGKERHRYWVLTRNEHRPESLHAVDFEIDNGDRSCGAYDISTAGTDFVAERLETLLREWEKDSLLD